MSEVFTKKDAEEFKEDLHSFMEMIVGGNNQCKLRHVIDTQMDIRRQMQEITDSDRFDSCEEIIDNINNLYDKITSFIKEQGNIVIAQIHMDRKLNTVMEEQKAIRNKIAAYMFSENWL